MSDVIRQLLERVGELERRLEHMVVRGKIAEVDPEKALARVNYGTAEKTLLTGWLPWKPIRTGNSTVWWVPDIDEGVTVISNGDLAQGEIFFGSYHEGLPAPSTDPNVFLVQFADGSSIQHDKSTGNLDIKITGNTSINVEGNTSISTNGNTSITTKGKTDISSDGEISVTTKADANVKSDGNIIATAKQIKMNNGAGCITGESICHFTGSPHGDMSKTVFAGK